MCCFAVVLLGVSVCCLLSLCVFTDVLVVQIWVLVVCSEVSVLVVLIMWYCAVAFGRLLCWLCVEVLLSMC